MFTIVVSNFHEEHQAKAALVAALSGHPDLVGRLEEQPTPLEAAIASAAESVPEPDATPTERPAKKSKK